ncbi:MAG: tyrosine-type recombinase/integrase [Actinomycetota bacterium]|nr:tyrosine-type recombinase/integrase [Actinomycetota bacterium]
MSANDRRRAYGTGSLELRTDSHGRETYYGRFRTGGKQHKVKLGEKRKPGEKTGLTKSAAERARQKIIDNEIQRPPIGERIDLATAGDRYLTHLAEVMKRKPSTIQDYEIMLRKHLVPFFAGRSIRIDTQLVGDFLLAKQRDGLSSKTVANQLTFLHGVFRHAMKKGWANANPVAAVDRPREAETDADIRFLTHEEVEALLRNVTDEEFAAIDYPLVLIAFTCGLRQGELVALRWRDVDWVAGVIRVRVNYTRGNWGTPKSRRSSRAVPMTTRVARELDRLFQRSRFQADDDLVFGHPILGSVLDASRLRKRFKESLNAAGVRTVRFHDLRHTFGTQAAAAGVPLRTLQEWMGHRDYKTTLIYADYAPRAHERRLLENAFGDHDESGGFPVRGQAPGRHPQRHR